MGVRFGTKALGQRPGTRSVSDEAIRKEPTEEEVARARAALRAVADSWKGNVDEGVKAYIREQRKDPYYRTVIWDEDGPRLVREPWDLTDEESQR